MDYIGKKVKVLGISNEQSQGCRAKSQIGEVLQCELGKSLAITFPNGNLLRTSRVIDISSKGLEIKVTTINSKYYLEIKEEK
jgi:hypothetical protein|nr:MAG TPA: hypothetical protein [Bacteriophage sp.]